MRAGLPDDAGMPAALLKGTKESRPPFGGVVGVAPATSTLAYLSHVDGMRALAVIAVVLHHLHVPGFGGGFVGVDVFLVISGFLITRLLLAELRRTNTISLPAFYGRRIRRLAPAMFATLAVTLLSCLPLFSPGDAMVRTGKDGLAALLSVSNIRFWAGVDYFAPSSSLRPFLHTWSLSVEEQFYLVWPAVLCGAWRLGWRGAKPLSLLIAVVGASSFGFNFVCSHGLPSWLPFVSRLPEAARGDGKSSLYYLLPFRVYEFAIGGLLASTMMDGADTHSASNSITLPTSTKHASPRAHGLLHDAAFVAGLACIIAAIARFDSTMLFPALPGMLPCIGAALCITAGQSARLRPVLTNSVATWIGTISYSLYLVHWPLIAMTTYVVGHVPRDLSTKLALGAAALACAVLLHACVERPCRRSKRRLAVPIAGAGAALAVACALIAAREGRPWPLPRVTFPKTVTLPTGPVNLPVASANDFTRQYYGGADYEKPVVFGHSPPDVIVIGDSVGRSFGHGLFQELGPGTPYNMSFYMMALQSILWTPNVVRARPAGYDWASILATNIEDLGAMLRQAPQRKPVVLLGQSWLGQMGRSYLIDGSGHKIERKMDMSDIVNGLVLLKKRASIDTLVVVGQVPPLPCSDLYDLLTRPTQIGNRIKFNVHGFTCSAKATKINAALKKAANETGAFTFLDPALALRKQGLCVAVNEAGDLLFSDQAHLSKEGSRAVMKRFARELTDLRKRT